MPLFWPMAKRDSIHDNFIRTILANKELAADYFENCLPDIISQQLDFSTLEQQADSYLSDELQKTLADIVYACYKKGGAEKIKVCLLIEHKSYPDKYTPIQIGGYIFSAWQKQVANKEPLSVVVPVLFYHGKGKWQYRTVADLFGKLETEWKQFLPDFSYVYNNLNDMPDSRVEMIRNEFLAASLLALKHSFQKNWLEENALRMLILAENAPESLQRSFLIYLFGRGEIKAESVYKLLESLSDTLKENIMSTLDIFMEKGRKEGIEIGIDKGIEKGIEKGIRIGVEKKNYDIVKNLIIKMGLSDSQAAEVAEVSVAFVAKVREELKN